MATPTSSVSANLAENQEFQQRVKHFMQKAAVAVLGEASPTQARSDYSAKVLNGDASVREMAYAVTTNGTIQTGINMSVEGFGVTDSDLEFTVNSMWDDFSFDVGDIVV